MPPLVRRCLFLPAVFAALLPFGAARSDEAPTTLGKKIDDFTLKDTANKEWRLSGVKDVKVVVPPAEIKDVRAWVRSGARRGGLLEAIRFAPPHRAPVRTRPSMPASIAGVHHVH